MGLPAIKKPVKRPLRFEHIVVAQYFHAGTPLGMSTGYTLCRAGKALQGVFFLNADNPFCKG